MSDEKDKDKKPGQPEDPKAPSTGEPTEENPPTSDLPEEEIYTCSWCENTNETEGVVIFAEKGINICSQCVQKMMATMEQMDVKTFGPSAYPEDSSAKIDTGIRPSEIQAHLDQYVIGQDHAKRVLSVAVYNHYKMLRYRKLEKPAVELEKSNVMLLGPTGCGKTFLLRTLAKKLGVPFAQGDATNLTAAGYVGEDVENVIRILVENANGDIKKAEMGIVYIDEIDKLSRKGENVSITRDVGGEGVQQSLLKMIEGMVVEVAPKGQRKHPGQETMKVDTTNILFICGGSFEGIEKIIGKRLAEKSSIGFGSDVKAKKERTLNELVMDVTVEDLKKFGMLPEFLGRMPILSPMQQLDEQALLQILTVPKNALVKQYQELMKMDGIQLEFEEAALKAIAQKAIARRTGARALRSIMEGVLLPHMHALPDDPSIVKVTITEVCVNEGAEPLFERKEIS